MRPCVRLLVVITLLTFLWLFLSISTISENPQHRIPLVNVDALYDTISFPSNIVTNISVHGQTVTFAHQRPRSPQDQLTVFLVFHSHLDPGWTSTVDQYYQEQVVRIIRNMIIHLDKNADARFIWSETSFLERFWRSTTDVNKQKIRRFIASGQLEICGASWVMTDEATPYFWASIDNIVEGQRFVYDTFNYTATTYWSVDPFGHGSMPPLLMPLAGVKNMVISRASETVKVELRKRASLVFNWAQPWQRRYYNNGALLVTIGDDFYFRSKSDFPEMYTNYKKMMTHINSNPKYRTQVRFAKVTDYFDHLRNQTKLMRTTPVLRGDFFPYTETMQGTQPYWTGFYVHRANFKRLERKGQAKLRRLDLMRSVSGMEEKQEQLTKARREFALSQHHDSLTGTSKKHVMYDYRTRLMAAINTFSMMESKILGGSNIHDIYDDGQMIEINGTEASKRLVLFNQNIDSEDKLITLTVNTKDVEVVDENGRKLEIQVNPGFEKGIFEPNDKLFEVNFYIKIPPISTRTITVLHSSDEIPTSEFKMIDFKSNPMISVAIKIGRINFKYGYIDSFTTVDNKTVTLKMRYGYYVDVGGAYVFNPITAFTDLPVDANTKVYMVTGPMFTMIYTRVYVPESLKFASITQMTRIEHDQSNGFGIDMDVFSDMTHLRKETFAIALDTDINAGGRFYTDVNGLYFMQRLINRDFDLAANFYPVASSAMIQNRDCRLTVLTGQPTGATLYNGSSLVLFVDRNVAGDDGKGLSYADGLSDLPALLKYKILLDWRIYASPPKTVYHSQRSHYALDHLLYPPAVVSAAKESNVRLKNVTWPCDVQLINLRKVNDFHLLTMRRVEFEKSIGHDACDMGAAQLLHVIRHDLLPTPPNRLQLSTLAGIDLADAAELTAAQLASKLKPFQIVTIKMRTAE